MARWISISVEDLEDAKVAALVTALRTKALGDSQDDPSERIIQDIVTDLRRKIASCRNNQVDSDESTIPASLKPLACDLIVYRLKNRLEIELTEDERAIRRSHERTLDRIASCEDVIEQPDTSAVPAVQSTAGTPSIDNTAAACRREKRSGL